MAAGEVDRPPACAVVAAMLVVGLAARLYDIDAMPYWLDEVTTVQRSSMPFWGMVQNALAAHHLPSYFAITSVLARYGLSEALLRLPSAIFGGAACGVVSLIVPDRGPIEVMNFFLRRQKRALPDSTWTKDVFIAPRHLDEGSRVWAVAGKVGQADHTSRESFYQVIWPLGQPIATLEEGELITFKLFAHPSTGQLAEAGINAQTFVSLPPTPRTIKPRP